MSIVTQNFGDDIEVEKSHYDLGWIRSLSLEEQTFFRKIMLETWQKLIKGANGKGGGEGRRYPLQQIEPL